MRDVALGTLPFLHFHFLEVDRKRDVTDRAIRKSDANGEIDYVLDMSRPHDALIASGDIHVETVERDILLGVGSDQVVELQAGNRQYGLAIHLGIVEAVQQVNAAGTGSGQTYTQLAGEFRISACHKSGRLFVPDLDEANLVFVSAEGLHDAVDAVAGQSKHDIDTPVD